MKNIDIIWKTLCCFDSILGMTKQTHKITNFHLHFSWDSNQRHNRKRSLGDGTGSWIRKNHWNLQQRLFYYRLTLLIVWGKHSRASPQISGTSHNCDMWQTQLKLHNQSTGLSSLAYIRNDTDATYFCRLIFWAYKNEFPCENRNLDLHEGPKNKGES